MSAHKPKVASLAFVRRVRDAQMLHAEQQAVGAHRDDTEAKASLAEAAQACDDAMVAWFAVAGDGLHFDPELACTFAHVINRRDGARVDAERACEKADSALFAARQNWQASVTLAENAAEKLRVAQRRAGLFQAEKQLAELADATAFRSVQP